MSWFLLTGFFILNIIITNGSNYENCKIKENQAKYPVLPGMGWDNLQNMEMGKVLDLRFSKCRYSDDNKYLIPNKVSLYPKHLSEVQLSAELMDHFMNYSSTTSRSMNFKSEGFISHFQLGGQFSSEVETVKSYQLETRSKIVRVQLRYNLYKAISEPDTPLHPNFHNRIMQLAKWLINYNETFYSTYLADMIIRDYGTHVIRTIDAGGTLSKVDLLSIDYVTQSKGHSETIEASASASFLKLFKLDAKFTIRSTQLQIDEYNKRSNKIILKSYGGAPLGTDLLIDKWVESLEKNLVPIDRTGDPIYYALNVRVLPNISNNLIHRISNLLMDSVNRYYNANSRKGCLNFNSPNFNSDANVDDGKCKEPIVLFTFGGVYEVCEGPGDQCASIYNPNPLTGGYSCPSGFSSVLLHSGLNECREYCKTKWIFWKSCHTECSYFRLYWCYPLQNSPNLNGYRFGGFINPKMPVCPLGYFPLKLGNSATFCVTNDASVNNIFAQGFGGFYSCNVGNPLARSFFKDANNNIQSSSLKSQSAWLHECASGYISHIATFDRNCQISYCTETNKFTLGVTPKINRPPFFKVSFSLNETSKVLYSKKGEMFIVNFNPNTLENMIVPSKNSQIPMIVLGCLLGLVLTVFVGFILRQFWKKKYIRSNKSIFYSNKEINRYGTLNDLSYEKIIHS